jgi:hypothetical protein
MVHLDHTGKDRAAFEHGGGDEWLRGTGLRGNPAEDTLELEAVAQAAGF